MGELGGEAVSLDITTVDAPQRIARAVKEKHDGVDMVVHNAGITRDKKLANMPPDRWTSVIDVNLAAPERITTELLEQKLIRPNGRIVGVASIAGIAGNLGQTNYATSKAGVIGFVDAFAPIAAEQDVTVNAVAPGFIETQMTAAIPLVIREAGRRMNSMSQGGLPVDVAETVAWFAHPASSRRHRQRRPGLRPEPAGGLRWQAPNRSRRVACSTSHPRSARSTSRPPCRRSRVDRARRRRRPTGHSVPAVRLGSPAIAPDRTAPRAYRDGLRLPDAARCSRRRTRILLAFPLAPDADDRPGLPVRSDGRRAHQQPDRATPFARRRRTPRPRGLGRTTSRPPARPDGDRRLRGERPGRGRLARRDGAAVTWARTTTTPSTSIATCRTRRRPGRASGHSRATSVAGTPPCPATATRSTSTT